MTPRARLARGYALCLLLWAAAMTGCERDRPPLTQIVVVVDSDLMIPGEIDALEIEVSGATSASAEAHLASSTFPRSLGLVHSGGALGPVRVRVRGLHDSAVVVERSAEVSFRARQTLLLQLPLSRSCAVRSAPCAEAETCDAGSCVPQRIEDLPVFSGKVSGFDVGPPPPEGGRGGTAGMAGNGGAGGRAGRGGIGGAAGSSPVGGGGAPAENLRPVCEILRPKNADNFRAGDPIEFSGGCNDPESGGISNVRWKSDRDGPLGTAGKVTRSNLSAGTHAIDLCATDPDDDNLEGCTTIAITVNALPVVSANVISVVQGANDLSPYQTGSEIVATGSASGIEPLRLNWSDSLTGMLGSEATATLSDPIVGKHLLTLQVRDAQDRSDSASYSAIVLEPNQSKLISPFSMVNQQLMGGVDVLSSASISAYAAVGPGKLWRFDPSEEPSGAVATMVANTEPSVVRDVFLHKDAGRAYIALSTGYQTCIYSPATGIDGGMCTTYFDGGLPSNDTTAIVRLTVDGSDRLLVGTTKGLWVVKDVDDPSSGGDKRLDNKRISAFAASSQRLWIATSSGLYRYDIGGTDPFGSEPIREPVPSDGAGDTLSDVAVGSGGTLWVSSNNGISRLSPGSSGVWTNWRSIASSPDSPPSLASNDVRALAVARDVNIAGTPRDIVWIATSAGVSRLDPTIPSFTNFIAGDDGLLSNNVRAVVVLVNGNKVFGSDQGVSLYKGM